MPPPQPYPNTFKAKVGGSLVVYQPTASIGPSLINSEAAEILQLVDGHSEASQILTHCRRQNPDFTGPQLNRILSQFEQANLISWKKPPVSHPSFTKSKTLVVWFHLTNQCNLRCTYCYVHKTPAKMNPHQAKLWLTKILINAQKHGYQTVRVKFTGGEALLETKNLFGFIHHFKTEGQKYHLQTEAYVLTNGVLLSPSLARDLKHTGASVTISLDGSAPYHDQVRIFPGGGGTHAFVIQGIKHLQAAKVPFSVNITVTAKNAAGLPRLTRQLLNQKIYFSYNFYRENQLSGKNLTNDTLKLIKYIKQAYREIFRNPPPYPVIDSLLDRTNLSQPHAFTCGVGRNYLVINHTGHLSSCQMILNQPIGHMDDPDPIKSMQTQSFIPHGLSVDHKTPCNTCQWRYLCCGGCPLATFQATGRYDTGSPYCRVYQALIPELLKLEAKRLIKYGQNIAHTN